MMSRLGFSAGTGPATWDVFSFSVEGSASASTSAALMTAFSGDWMGSLRCKPGIEDSDLETGEWRTRGLSISVGTTERVDVCKFFKVDPRVGGREGGMKMVAVGVDGNEIGWRRLRRGGCGGGV